MSGAGHNSIAGEEILQVIERIERLEEEKSEVAGLVKEVYAEAKGRGYDVKVLRKLISERRRAAEDVAEEAAILDLYREAIKMPTGPRHPTNDGDH